MMKTFCMVTLVAMAVLTMSAHAGPSQELREQDKLSYSIGMEVARNFKKGDVPLDPDMVMRGMKDGLAGDRPQLSEKEFRKVIGEFQLQMRQRTAANVRMLIAENRKKAEEFLLNNKSREGVQSLSGGLQFKVLQAGQGALPLESDAVQINYRLSLIHI